MPYHQPELGNLGNMQNFHAIQSTCVTGGGVVLPERKLMANIYYSIRCTFYSNPILLNFRAKRGS
jgi:hypothetical protein